LPAQRLLLTGAHAGCEHGVCGDGTVLVDGAPVCSCLMFAVQAHGYAIRTIEGRASSPALAWTCLSGSLVVTYRADMIDIRVMPSTSDRFVVINERYHPDWRARAPKTFRFLPPTSS
jgi:hypothetical protein